MACMVSTDSYQPVHLCNLVSLPCRKNNLAFCVSVQQSLTLLHSELPELHRVLATLSVEGLNPGPGVIKHFSC